MKVKTINSLLGKKFNSFLKSIKDEKVKVLVEQNTIISGGCIASLLLEEEVSDFDLYFRNQETVEAVAEYYIERFKENSEANYSLEVRKEEDRIKIFIESSGVASIEEGEDDEKVVKKLTSLSTSKTKRNKNKYTPIFLSTNAITLSDQIQIVIRFYGEPEEIHDNYDYVHCMNYWTSWKNKVVLKKEALECLLTKELRYHGSRYPLASLIRMRKFIRRGWSITAGQILKMVMQLQNLDLKNPQVLGEQLTGVDVSYFSSLLFAIESGSSELVDSNYVCSLIDSLDNTYSGDD